MGTSVAPATHGTQISSNEKSNAIVIPWYTRSRGRIPYTSAATRTKLQMLGVLDRDALGPAGRAGGVDDVGELVGGPAALGVDQPARVQVGDQVGGLVDPDQLGAAREDLLDAIDAFPHVDVDSTIRTRASVTM